MTRKLPKPNERLFQQGLRELKRALKHPGDMSRGRTTCRKSRRCRRARVPVYACGLAVLLLCIELYSVLDISIPFVYFQF